MMYRPFYSYRGNEKDPRQPEQDAAGGRGWSASRGDVDDFIFRESGEYEEGDPEEYRSAR